ncbi:hypothetical protein [Sphingobacterium puteale]|uniref:hypothetical protein n=1 Tax=Sphingobacterium puteale TaxID=2420510 RepID=UPI003D98BBEA
MKIHLLFLIVSILVIDLLYGKVVMAQYASLSIQLGTFISVNSIPAVHHSSSVDMISAPDSLVVRALGTFEMQVFRKTIDSMSSSVIEGNKDKSFPIGNRPVLLNQRGNTIKGLGQIKFPLESEVETIISITAL